MRRVFDLTAHLPADAVTWALVEAEGEQPRRTNDPAEIQQFMGNFLGGG